MVNWAGDPKNPSVEVGLYFNHNEVIVETQRLGMPGDDYQEKITPNFFETLVGNKDYKIFAVVDSYKTADTAIAGHDRWKKTLMEAYNKTGDHVFWDIHTGDAVGLHDGRLYNLDEPEGENHD